MEIAEKVCKEVGLKPSDRNLEIINNLLKETVKLGLFNMKKVEEDNLIDLMNFLKTYVEEIILYSKSPKKYKKRILEKLEEYIHGKK